MTRTTLRFAALGALVLAGCAESDQEPGSAVLDEDQLYQVSATVLESPEHGPQLCDAVAESYPPQCGGPDLVGWDWSEVEAESAAGTTWGYYTLVGTWDGERFTPVEVREPDPEEPVEQPDFGTPCPEPEGGWAPVDPETATQAALDEALARAATADDYAGSWVAWPGENTAVDQMPSDPSELVLNLRFTGNLAEREQWIREVWGGALCVSEARHTEAELVDIQWRVQEEVSGLLGSGIDVVGNTVTARVIVATPELQADLDEQYGEGTVTLEGWLRPVG
jgi:hypothetical protein